MPSVQRGARRGQRGQGLPADRRARGPATTCRTSTRTTTCPTRSSRRSTPDAGAASCTRHLRRAPSVASDGDRLCCRLVALVVSAPARAQRARGGERRGRGSGGRRGALGPAPLRWRARRRRRRRRARRSGRRTRSPSPPVAGGGRHRSLRIGSAAGPDLTPARRGIPPGYGTVAASRAARGRAQAAPPRPSRPQAAGRAPQPRRSRPPRPGRGAVPSSRPRRRRVAGARRRRAAARRSTPAARRRWSPWSRASSRRPRAQLTAWEHGPPGWTAVLGPVHRPDRRRPASAGRARAPPGRRRALSPHRGLRPRGRPGHRHCRTGWSTATTGGSPTSPAPATTSTRACAPGTCPFDEWVSENLARRRAPSTTTRWSSTTTAAAPRAPGSAFFLHVSNGAPTAGCVAIDRRQPGGAAAVAGPGRRPVIAIGVG